MCIRVLTPMTLLSFMHFVSATTPTPIPPPLLPQGLRYTPHSTATKQGPARVGLAWVGAPLSPFCFLRYAACLSNPRWKLRQKALPQSWCQGCCVAEEKAAWVQEGAQQGTCMNSLWPPSSMFPSPQERLAENPSCAHSPGWGQRWPCSSSLRAQVPTWSQPPVYPG